MTTSNTLRHPGLGEVSATLVSAGLNALRLEWWFPPCCHPAVHAPASQDLDLPPSSLTLQSCCFAIVLN